MCGHSDGWSPPGDLTEATQVGYYDDCVPRENDGS